MPWKLVLRNSLHHPVRSILTVLSLTVALFLLCTLRAVSVSLDASVQDSAANRIMVQSAVSLFVDLPLSYQAKIEAVDGVDSVCKWQWFGGTYQDEFFAQFAVDQDTLLQTYPEIQIVDGSVDDFLADRRGCILGRSLATKLGLDVGQSVPIEGTIFAKHTGEAWDFVLQGIYESSSANVGEATMFFHFDYLDKTLEAGECAGSQGAGVFAVRMEPGTDPAQVGGAIDLMFENGPQRVRSTTEAEFQRQFVSMMGNVPTLINSIGGGVLFAIFLGVLNTMFLAGRERTRDFGVLKALGFTDRTCFGLLAAESLLLCVIGGLVGVLLAMASAPGLRGAMEMQNITGYSVSLEIAGVGLIGCLILGFTASALPAWRAARLKPVDAFQSDA